MNASKKILAGMSHEIRTYMNSIVSYSFLNDDKSRQNSNDAKYANIIFNTCTQVLSLMENYLQSTLIDRENPKVVLEKCSPAGIIDELIPLFKEIIGQERASKIRLIIENSCSSYIDLYLDKDKVSKSIQNFFRNSVNNMDHGYIRVGCMIEKSAVLFYVLDSLQEHSKSREFLNTNDLDRAMTKYFDAVTAVNTLLSKQLVNLMGGTIEIVCNELCGTGVYISIPVEYADKENAVKKKNVGYPAMWRKLVSFII